MSLSAPSSAEPRVATRRKVFLPAEMKHAAGTSRVHLLNLSSTGALLHADAAPAKGVMVQLSCGKASWLAKVVWTSTKRFGVHHLTPLTPAAVEALAVTR